MAYELIADLRNIGTDGKYPCFGDDDHNPIKTVSHKIFRLKNGYMLLIKHIYHNKYDHGMG